MLELIFKVYAFLFSRKIFKKLNTFLYHLSLRGLGILNFQGEYFVGERCWLNNYLKDKKEPVIFDIGANVGTYSNYILNCNTEAIVFAFEPHPKTYKKLTSNTKNNRFKSFNLGVGDTNEELQLYDYDNKDGSSHASLYKDVIKDLHKGNPISHSVKMIKLDDFLLDHSLSTIDLLKIDTEGNEFKVLLGALSALDNKKIKAIHFEFNEMNIVSKVTFKDFWDLLNNYKFYRILPGGKLLPIEKYSPIACEIFAFQNIVALLN
jgi:FkbM family methyltransferase